MRFDAHWLAARGEGASPTCRPHPGGPAPGRSGTSRGRVCVCHAPRNAQRASAGRYSSGGEPAAGSSHTVGNVTRVRTTELVKVTHTGDCLRMRSWLALVCAAVAAGSFLTDVSTQPEALDLLASSEHTVTEPDVLLALERGWWDAAKQMLRTMRKAGHAVGTMQDVRGAATRIRDQATDIINLMRVGANAEETVVNAAFQWAQRPEFIYLNVKFASRIDGPVTCLNVDNEKVTLTNNSLLFEAVGRQKPKTFRLNLTFNKEIDPEASTWSFASVGRISFTIAKKDHGEHPPACALPASRSHHTHSQEPFPWVGSSP